jgi:signal transduction histidine kinase
MNSQGGCSRGLPIHAPLQETRTPGRRCVRPNTPAVSLPARSKTDRLAQAALDRIGRGFNVAEIQNGPERGNLGLAGMAERARQVDGRMDFQSSPGEGTEIRAVFPLTASPN